MDEKMSTTGGAGTPQLRLALARDPRISTGKTPTQRSPTKLSPPVEERKGSVTPSTAAVNLVGGAKTTQAQVSSSSTHKVSSQPTTLTQTHLFSNKAKLLPAIPKLKSDAVIYGDLKNRTASILATQASQLSHSQLKQLEKQLEKKLVAQYSSTVTQPKLPPPLIQLLSKAQNKQPQPKATTSISSVVSAPLVSNTSSPSIKLLPPSHTSSTTDDILPPKAKRIKTAMLPVSRVKTIMKTNIQSSKPAPQLSQESVLVITKATELFISKLSQEAEKVDQNSGFGYNQLASTVQGADKFKFLQDILPKKVLGKEYLQQFHLE